MAYHSLSFFALFVPAVLIAYTLTPVRFRYLTLLAANYLFFYTWSKGILIYNLLCVAITYLSAQKLAGMRKAPKGADRKLFKKKKKRILACTILCNLLILLVLKYTNFFGETICTAAGREWQTLHILMPIGISYYTLQSISYLADTASGKVIPDRNIAKLALYLSFFPILVEGPICRYSEIGEDLSSGREITYHNLTQGYQRILWGLFKKMTIADYLAIAVDQIFANYDHIGSICLFGAVLYTIQLYCDFSGTIDVVIGTAKLFGVVLPENFRQPFFAKDAGDFWRRWHMTLGAFFRDYIFYPVSLSAPVMKITKWAKTHGSKTLARLIGPLIALFCVWSCNGLWHGAAWTYIMYGMYYFVILAVEMIIKEPSEHLYDRLHIRKDSKALRIFRFVKLMVIIVLGEMLFRAESVSQFTAMFTNIFTHWDGAAFRTTYTMLGIGRMEYLVTAFGFMIVIIMDILKETGYPIRRTVEKMPAAVRWAFWYTAILYVIFFGAYGPGFNAAAMMYAAF